MQSQLIESDTAEGRFRQAFERLKADDPKVLAPDTPVSQNNVAREAGRDPSALKKSRFPELVREIQAYVELHQAGGRSESSKAKRKRAANRSVRERMDDAIRQRDQVQSILASANMRIIELSEEVRLLQLRLDQVQPPPVRLY